MYIYTYICICIYISPYEPFDIKGVPYDERVHLYWKPPPDVGGYNISDFVVERVPFTGGQSLKFHKPELSSNVLKLCATGLTNFIPWYFRVTALNILGAGPPSKHSPAYTPWVLPADEPTQLRATTGNRRVYLSWKAPAYDGGRFLSSFMIEIAHDQYSRARCADPHGCVPDVAAHQALDGHQGHQGLWARIDDPEPSPAALEWSLVNAEPFSPDCLAAPVLPPDCPSLLLTTARQGTSGKERLKLGARPPSGSYPISENSEQVGQLLDSVFVADDPHPAWNQGLCVNAQGKRVSGMIRLSAALVAVDDVGMMVCLCQNVC
jgi:hypothetical protein